MNSKKFKLKKSWVKFITNGNRLQVEKLKSSQQSEEKKAVHAKNQKVSQISKINEYLRSWFIDINIIMIIVWKD